MTNDEMSHYFFNNLPSERSFTGFDMANLEIGRFSNLIQTSKRAIHSMQVFQEEIASSFILNLNADGGATVCRGWRYLFFNDGPDLHTTEHLREQLGYKGHWYKKNEWLHIDISLDENVCLPVKEYSNLVPHHATQWSIRCLAIFPKGHPTLNYPLLACQCVDSTHAFGEDQPHLVSDVILPGSWILLGPDNGLVIKIISNEIQGDETPVIQIEPAQEFLREDAWMNPF